MTNQPVTLWEHPRVADQLDIALHDPNQTVDTVLALIPSLFGISNKATYLALRGLGLTPKETLKTMDLEEDLLYTWRHTDPKFLEFEYDHLHRLQREVSTEIIRLGFLRNMALFVAKDAQIIRKATRDLEALSKREYEYLGKVRSHYTSSDLLALDKALAPERHEQKVVISLSFGDTQQVLEGVEVPYLIEEADDEQLIGGRVLASH